MQALESSYEAAMGGAGFGQNCHGKFRMSAHEKGLDGHLKFEMLAYEACTRSAALHNEPKLSARK